MVVIKSAFFLIMAEDYFFAVPHLAGVHFFEVLYAGGGRTFLSEIAPWQELSLTWIKTTVQCYAMIGTPFMKEMAHQVVNCLWLKLDPALYCLNK